MAIFLLILLCFSSVSEVERRCVVRCVMYFFSRGGVFVPFFVENWYIRHTIYGKNSAQVNVNESILYFF